MDPVAENVNTHCLKPRVVLSLENGKEGVCGKEGFQCARRNYSVKREKIPPVMTGETSQGESIPEAATWKFTGTNKNRAAQVGHITQHLCFTLGMLGSAGVTTGCTLSQVSIHLGTQ